MFTHYYTCCLALSAFKILMHATIDLIHLHAINSIHVFAFDQPPVVLEKVTHTVVYLIHLHAINSNSFHLHALIQFILIAWIVQLDLLAYLLLSCIFYFMHVNFFVSW